MRLVRLLALCAALLAGCGGSTVPGAATGGSAPAAPDSPRLGAEGQKFDRADLSLPARRPFTLVFDNRETLPHNVSLRDASGGAVFTGEVFPGPGQRVYAIPAIAAGTYAFRCDVHPDMKGVATAR